MNGYLGTDPEYPFFIVIFSVWGMLKYCMEILDTIVATEETKTGISGGNQNE